MRQDAFRELNFEDEKTRGRFGDREVEQSKIALPSRAGYMQFTFILRSNRALSLAVTDGLSGGGMPWIFLPKSEITYELFR